MRRILGVVSYYVSNSAQDLYPELHDTEFIKVPMSDYQFSKYVETRSDERKQESSGRFKKISDDGSAPGQVYRAFSRASCNYVFPEKIDRPFPSKLKLLNLEIDKDELDDDGLGDETKKEKLKTTEINDYSQLLKEAMDKLEDKKEFYFIGNELEKCGPKFARLSENVDKSPGSILIYSQFRTVEGLGICSLVLKAKGYSEFKLKKNDDGEYVIDIDEDDLDKPKYAFFTGDKEVTGLIIKIFNSEFDSLPQSLLESLKPLLDKYKDTLHGDIIKCLFITQSGAEGISLQNVRQVHILEPYWNAIRTEQVIGRAVRTCSHQRLNKEERNVKVFMYCSVFTEMQLEKEFSIRRLDKGRTTDENISAIAAKKSKITQGILD